MEFELENKQIETFTYGAFLTHLDKITKIIRKKSKNKLPLKRLIFPFNLEKKRFLYNYRLQKFGLCFKSEMKTTLKDFKYLKNSNPKPQKIKLFRASRVFFLFSILIIFLFKKSNAEILKEKVLFNEILNYTFAILIFIFVFSLFYKGKSFEMEHRLNLVSRVENIKKRIKDINEDWAIIGLKWECGKYGTFLSLRKIPKVERRKSFLEKINEGNLHESVIIKGFKTGNSLRKGRKRKKEKNIFHEN